MENQSLLEGGSAEWGTPGREGGVGGSSETPNGKPVSKQFGDTRGNGDGETGATESKTRVTI